MWTTNPVPRLPAGCPWSEWAPPNVKWCEDNLCSWVTAPANTWSNLAFLIVAVLLWRMAKRDSIHTSQGSNAPHLLDPRALRYFAPAAAVVGISSMIFHASYTGFFQFFDYVGMYVFFFLLISFNFRRMGMLLAGAHLPFYAAGVAGMSALIPVFGAMEIPIQLSIPILILVIAAQEGWIRFGLKRRADYRWFVASFAALGLAAAALISDATRTWCEPANHWLQPHALWHGLAAMSLYLAYLFYRQFFIRE